MPLNKPLRTKLTAALLLLTLLCGIFAAPAAAAGVRAEPNQKLAFRTGPNTRYTEIGTFPQSTSIRAYAYAEGNGVTWVQVEFVYKGQVYRGYTGLKRMSVLGDIPWERNYNMSNLVNGYHDVYAAPRGDAAVLGWVGNRELVTLLDVENGYDYIEFYDRDAGAPSRGYIVDPDSRPTSSGFTVGGALFATDGDGAYITEDATVYEQSNGNSRRKGTVARGQVAAWLGNYGNYVHILYSDYAIGELSDGYVERGHVAMND